MKKSFDLDKKQKAALNKSRGKWSDYFDIAYSDIEEHNKNNQPTGKPRRKSKTPHYP
jgi:hypothetical protein